MVMLTSSKVESLDLWQVLTDPTLKRLERNRLPDLLDSKTIAVPAFSLTTGGMSSQYVLLHTQTLSAPSIGLLRHSLLAST